MKRTRSLLAALAAFTLMACTSVEMPKGTSEGYKSARFFVVGGEVTPTFVETGAPINASIQSAIRESFESHGIAVRATAAEGADLVIGYLLLAQDATTTASIDSYFGYDRSRDIVDLAHKRGVLDKDKVSFYKRGAIVIDVLDTKTDTLVYRNAIVGDIVDGVSNEERSKRIKAAVADALDGFFES